MYNTKNYMEQGGEKTVIGGTLEILDGASVTGMTTATIVDNLTTDDATKALSAKQGKALKTLIDGKTAANQAASVEAASPTVAEFNALLTKLKAAGLMVADAQKGREVL